MCFSCSGEVIFAGGGDNTVGRLMGSHVIWRKSHAGGNSNSYRLKLFVFFMSFVSHGCLVGIDIRVVGMRYMGNSLGDVEVMMSRSLVGMTWGRLALLCLTIFSPLFCHCYLSLLSATAILLPYKSSCISNTNQTLKWTKLVYYPNQTLSYLPQPYLYPIYLNHTSIWNIDSASIRRRRLPHLLRTNYETTVHREVTMLRTSDAQWMLQDLGLNVTKRNKNTLRLLSYRTSLRKQVLPMPKANRRQKCQMVDKLLQLQSSLRMCHRNCWFVNSHNIWTQLSMWTIIPL